MTGNLELDGEAWKDRDMKTYTSIPDRYGADGLFSTKMTNQYQEQKKAQSYDRELTEYLFSGQMQAADNLDAELADYLFAEELKLTRVRNYHKAEDNYSQIFWLSGILCMLLFSMALAKYNEHRKKRRAAYAVEIDMENQR